MSDRTVPRRLGQHGPEVAPLAFGCWRFNGHDVAEATRLVAAALDTLGGDAPTLVDTADIYGFDGHDGFGHAEELLGRVLAGAPSLRRRMVLATKGGIRPPIPYDQSPVALRRACEASLRRLGVERVDLYQIHRPDLLAHPAEVAATLSELVAEGKVARVGVSNFTPAQTAALEAHLPAGLDLATSQPEFHPLHLDPLVDGTLDHCMARGITPLAWSPLGGGALVGDAPPAGPAAEVAAVCDGIAALRGATRSAVLLAWLLAHPAGIVPIVGTQQPRRLAECATAVGVMLDRTEWYRILVAGRGEPMP